MVIPAATDESPFALLLPIRPISSGSGGKQRFQERIRAAATEAFGGRARLRGSLYARITYLHLQPAMQDVDNLIKRILDAMKGIVFDDDGEVRQCLAERIAVADRFTIAERRRPSGIVDRLLEFLAEGQPHITYIEVGHAARQALSFGPIGEEEQ